MLPKPHYPERSISVYSSYQLINPWQQYGWHPFGMGDAMAFLVVKCSTEKDMLLYFQKSPNMNREVGWTLSDLRWYLVPYLTNN